jgi:hypothetical protein
MKHETTIVQVHDFNLIHENETRNYNSTGTRTFIHSCNLQYTYCPSSVFWEAKLPQLLTSPSDVDICLRDTYIRVSHVWLCREEIYKGDMLSFLQCQLLHEIDRLGFGRPLVCSRKGSLWLQMLYLLLCMESIKCTNDFVTKCIEEFFHAIQRCWSYSRTLPFDG